MTRSQKRILNQLLIFLIILALMLTIALLIRRRMDRADADAAASADSSQTEQTNPTVFTAISWTNGETLQSFSKTAEGTWYWDADKDFPLDPTIINSVTDTLSNFQPVKSFAAGEALSAYGLENSNWTLTAAAQDGTTLTLTVGTQVPDRTGYYLLRSDKPNTVYVVDSTIPGAIGTAVYDMMRLPELPSPDTINAIFLNSAGKELSVTSADGVSWTCNGTDVTNNAVLAAMINSLSTLQPERCENFKPSADGLALWGMDAPAVTALISYDGDQLLTLQIGSKTLDGSGYYVRINEDTTIYSINAYDMENIIAVAQYGFAAPADTAQN